MKNTPFNFKILFIMLALNSVCLSDKEQKPNSGKMKEKRQQMVEWQIAARGITDHAVIKAMLKVERHLFVPEKYADYAYSDRPLPIGYNQTISQPYIVAFMTEKLNVQQYEKVLEVGTGSGYQAAILGELCDSVYSIEIVEPLGKQATELLANLGYKNVHIKIGDGYQGWPEHAPFDAIIVTCAPLKIPEPLKDQLKEGGRIIIPYGSEYNQRLVLMKKTDNKLHQVASIPVRFVPMVDEKGHLY